MKASTLLTFLLCLLSLHLYGQDLEIDTLLNNGNKDNRINFAFANVDHATANKYTEKADFLSDLGPIVERFDPDSPLAKNGYSQYSNFFNIYSVWFNDPFIFEAIPSYYQQSQAVIDDLFLPWADDQHGWVTMMYSLKGGGGGGAGRRDDLRRGDALIWGLDWETILHEFNHTMPGVGDEYTASGAWSNYVCNESPNQTPALTIDDVPWRKWITEDIPIPTPYSEEYFNKIGVFEGTISGYFGCHRPTAQSCYMGAGGFGEGFGQDMCSVCLQRFICRTYHFVDAIENEFPADPTIQAETNQSISFSVETVKPIPNTQQYKWYLNGQCIATNVETVDITLGECPIYEVTFELFDTTAFVRYDADFAHYYPEPRQSHIWIIENSAGVNTDLDAAVMGINADCTGNATGKIIIEPSGGQPPYIFILEGKEYGDIIENLSAGNYDVHIIDAEGCNIIREIEIGQDDIVTFELVSEFQDGVWKLYPHFTDGNQASDFDLSWSTGSTDNEIYVTEKNTYSLEVYVNANCRSSAEIELAKTPCAELSVSHEDIHPSSTADGAIFLSIENGARPYEIIWYKNLASDLTTPDAEAVFSSGNDQIAIHIAAFLFDDIVAFNIDFWAEGFTGANFAGYDFGSPTTIDFYSLTSNVDVQGRDAKVWTLQGSNNGNDWDILDTQSDITFNNRLERKEFLLDQEYTYRYYRIFITENHGDGWVAIQEMEFGSTKNPSEMKESANDPSLTGLTSGLYNYVVTDLNGNRQDGEVKLASTNTSATETLNVVPSGYDKVMIETPLNDMAYYWFADAETKTLLHIGDDFQPLSSGNYYVRAIDVESRSFATGTKGFAVTMQDAPEVESNNGTFTIVNPVPDAEYFWYDRLTGGQALHSGQTFNAPEMGDYFVSMRLIKPETTPLDPATMNGITLWADASDIDGNNQTDEGLENSSAYLWKFRQNGQWDPSGWHAYRANYSNGLGVVELATVWFQYIQNSEVQMRSFIIVYEENGFSREGSAPFYGLKNYMGRHSGQEQLFYDGISDATQNGIVHLNGDEVNPQTTYNSYNMKSLSVVLDQNVSLNLYACDEYWEGKIAEFIAFDFELSAEQIDGLHAFLRKKWLNTADLDSPRTKISWKDENTSYESNEEVALCYGEAYLGLTSPGTYIREMKTTEGFDSTVTTVLLVSELNPHMPPAISSAGNLLSVPAIASTYQWFKDGVVIDGAVQNEYEAAADGSYTVILTDDYGCNVETDPLMFILSSVSDPEVVSFRVYPNPFADFLTVEKNSDMNYGYTLTNDMGQVLKKGLIEASTHVLEISHLPTGIYVLDIGNEKVHHSYKLLKME